MSEELEEIKRILEVETPIRKLESIDPYTQEVLEDIAYEYERALRKGERYSEKETRRFGGSPLPGEPGWEKYFEKIE